MIVFLFSACVLVGPIPNKDVTCDDGSTAEAGECPEDQDSGDVADTAEEVVGDSGSTDSECYTLEGLTGSNCYATRPYIEIDMELAVGVYDSEFVSWDITVEAAPEGWVGINDLGAWLSFYDASGTGWTSELIDRLAYTDESDSEHAIGVVNSNGGGKSVVVGEVVGAEGGWAVGPVDAADTVVVTFTLDIQDLDVGNGDWVQLDLNTYQTWSSDEATAVESQFGDMIGTRFLFQ